MKKEGWVMRAMELMKRRCRRVLERAAAVTVTVKTVTIFMYVTKYYTFSANVGNVFCCCLICITHVSLLHSKCLETIVGIEPSPRASKHRDRRASASRSPRPSGPWSWRTPCRPRQRKWGESRQLRRELDRLDQKDRGQAGRLTWRPWIPAEMKTESIPNWRAPLMSCSSESPTATILSPARQSGARRSEREEKSSQSVLSPFGIPNFSHASV